MLEILTKMRIFRLLVHRCVLTSSELHILGNETELMHFTLFLYLVSTAFVQSVSTCLKFLDAFAVLLKLLSPSALRIKQLENGLTYFD